MPGNLERAIYIYQMAVKMEPTEDHWWKELAEAYKRWPGEGSQRGQLSSEELIHRHFNFK